MSVSAYPEYKDSGVEWIGKVPAHWIVCQLRSLCASISTGPFGTALGSADYVMDGVPVINPSHIVDGKCISDAETSVSMETAERLSPWQMQAGDLVVARRGEIGRSAVLQNEQTGWICGTGSLRIRPNFTVAHSDYLQSVFLSNYTREWLSLASVGSTMQNISEAIIASLPVAIPSNLLEQIAIIKFLDCETGKIDALVAEQERLMALLKEKRQAVISHAVTKGLDSTAPMKDSGVECIGNVPQGWEVTRLKFLAQVQGGIAKGRELAGRITIQVPYLRVANVQDGYLDLEEVTTIDIEPQELDRYVLKYGDVLMNEGGDFDKLGRGYIWRCEIANCIHQNHVFAVRPHHIEPEWLTLATTADYGRFFFMSRSKQSTNLASISSTNLQEMPVVCPPKAERIEILKNVGHEAARIADLTTQAERAIALLKERRAALISAAVTGKIDVRGLAAETRDAA